MEGTSKNKLVRSQASTVPRTHKIKIDAVLGAASLGRFSKEEQLLLSRTVFDRSHLTLNQLIRIAEWLSDLKRIRRTTLEQVLLEESLQEVLQHPLMDRKAKGERFFETVRELRFPRVSEALKGSRDESFL